MAQKHEIGFVDWNCLENWHEYDWIVLGTKSPEFLIRNDGLDAVALSHKLVIDLSVPRNADPAIARHPKITLLNIDQINR
ncbi:hypothetical protein, partial [Vibrio parahaemolyticus]|uniref:hypothetical protein n=1 Tax=Vibrio parahaemolyticus TaxID=670 RepID=UPI001A8FB407